MAGGLQAVPKNVTPRDGKHMSAVASLPCALWAAGRCYGEVVAHHVGSHGMALKASDYQTVPVCAQHHREAHDFSGWFKGYTRAQMETWEKATVEQTLATIERLKAGCEVVW